LNEINERFIVCVIEIFSRLIPREVKQKSFSNSFTMFYTAFMTLNICFMLHFYQTAYFFFSICLSFSIQNYISLIVTLSSRESHINRSFSLSLDRAKRQPAINSETREQRLYLDVYISMYIHIYIYIQMYIYIYIYIYILPLLSFLPLFISHSLFTRPAQTLFRIFIFPSSSFLVLPILLVYAAHSSKRILSLSLFPTPGPSLTLTPSH
jgi:hypothetical protein